MKIYVVGLDYRSDSVGTILIDTASGKDLSACVNYYRRWSNNKYFNASINQFRHYPLDQIEGPEYAGREVVKKVMSA